MASDVALFLRKKFVVSLSDVKRHLSDGTFCRFEEVRKHLGDDSTFLTGPESISLLYKLNDALADLRILKEQKNMIKRFFSFIDEAQMNEALSPIEEQLKAERSKSPPTGNEPDFLLDRFTIYNSGSLSGFVSFNDHVQNMSNSLSESDEGFKAVGIYGMGGSGKTALVKHVLNEEKVRGKFEPNIIWTCLSDLTREGEIDVKIVKYILYDLGFDIDSMSGNGHVEDNGWLTKQLEHELHKLGNYVLVLDDVWHCGDLIGLCRTLAKTSGGGGAAVIVTSRIEQVVRKIVGTENPLIIDLNPSYENENDDLLKKMVSQSRDNVNVDADEIIKVCHGLPLAAQILPSLMNA